MRDFQTAILQHPGINHAQLNSLRPARSCRLTNVVGEVVPELLASLSLVP